MSYTTSPSPAQRVEFVYTRVRDMMLADVKTVIDVPECCGRPMSLREFADAHAAHEAAYTADGSLFDAMSTTFDAPVAFGLTLSELCDRVGEGARESLGPIESYMYLLYMCAHVSATLDTRSHSDNLAVIESIMRTCDGTTEGTLPESTGDVILALSRKVAALSDGGQRGTVGTAKAEQPRQEAQEPEDQDQQEEGGCAGDDDDPLAACIDQLNNTSIGKLAKDIAGSIDVEALGIKEPGDIMGLMNDGNSAKALGKIIENVGSAIQSKMKSGEIKQEQLISDAMSLMSQMNGSNGPQAELFRSMMQHMGGGGTGGPF